MRRLMIGLLLVVGAGCAPVKNTPVEEIPKLDKLADVMANQSTTMDPLFKKMDQSTFSDGEFAQISAASTRMQATSLKIKDFTKGAEFDSLAMSLNQQATGLGTASAAKDANRVRQSLKDMKATCKDCHKRFR